MNLSIIPGIWVISGSENKLPKFKPNKARSLIFAEHAELELAQKAEQSLE